MKERPARILLAMSHRIFGGTERFVLNLASGLDRRKFTPVIWLRERGLGARLATELGIETLIANTDDPPRLASRLRRARIDLVQAGYYTAELPLAARRAGLPLLWRLGGHIDVVYPGRRKEHQRRLATLIACLADRIVCPSRFIAESFGAEARKLEVIINGVGPAPRARSADGPLRVLMVAHLVPQKRHLDLIDAVALAVKAGVDLRLHLVGSPYEANLFRRYPAEVKRRIQRHELRARVTQSTEVADAFRTADVAALPSIGEGCSNAILEAMAHGLPVVAAASGGNVELIQHGRTGLLVEPENPAALARAIQRLAKRPTDRTRLGRAARERARREFSLARMVRRYERAYLELLG